MLKLPYPEFVTFDVVILFTGGLDDMGGSSSGIISKGAMTPVGRAAKTPSAIGRSGVFTRSQAAPINPGV